MVGVACLAVLLLLHFRNTLTYDYEVKHFQATVRKQVDPKALQSWAITLLTRYTASNVVHSESTSYQIKELPTELQNVNKLYPSAFLFTSTSLERAFIT